MRRGAALATNAVPTPGDYVTVEWGLKLANGKPVPEELLRCDTGEVRFVVGAGGYIPALHSRVQLLDAVATEPTVFVVPAAEGWGEGDPRMGPSPVPKAQAPPGLKIGDTVGLSGGGTALVVDVTPDAVVIDANHPLAGEALELSVALKMPPAPASEALVEATFAGGCFWGVELAFQRCVGVAATKVGYTHGNVEDPKYQAVCSGSTGHTEAVHVMFDPALVSYDALCELFWDRLGESRYALNQVGNDRGTQYRHGIYTHTSEQLATARQTFEDAQMRDTGRPIRTEIMPASKFWDGEDYHQQYLEKGGQSAKKNDEVTIRCYG